MVCRLIYFAFAVLKLLMFTVCGIVASQKSSFLFFPLLKGLKKGVYSYEYMDDWEKIDETSLPEKYKFYSNLDIQDIADTDYMHAKKVCEDFETTKLGKNYGLYLESDILLLIDVLNTLKKCLEKLII